MLTTTLLSHQSQCIDQILDIHHEEQDQQHAGVVVSMRWGSGKTLTSIEAALVIRNQQPPEDRVPIFVITDVSTVDDWIKNATEHYYPSLSCTFVSGSARVDSSAALMNWHVLKTQDIIITNVEMLVAFHTTAYNRRLELINSLLRKASTSADRKRRLHKFIETDAQDLRCMIPDEEIACREMCTPTTDARCALFYTTWPVIIIDEAHKIRNSDSTWFYVIEQLKNKFRISLTATPFNNSINDVLAVLAVSNVAPPSRRACRQFKSIHDEWMDVYKSDRIFCEDFIEARNRYIIQGNGTITVERSHYRPVDIILRIPFDTEEERQHYEMLKTQDTTNTLKTMIRLKQTCSGIFEQDVVAVPTKIRAVLKYVEMVVNRNEKVNIMCEYRYSIAQLRTHIMATFGSRVTVYTVDGSTTHKDRSTIRAAYEAHRGSAVLIVTNVFNQGVNLHCANHTILFGVQWNPVVSDQGRSRCERPAQKRSVFSVQIIIADTIEDQIWSVATTKRKTNCEVMFGDVTPEIIKRIGEQSIDDEVIDTRILSMHDDVEQSMRDQCTHYIDSVEKLSVSVPVTTLLDAILVKDRAPVKRMLAVNVVVNGFVVKRRVMS